VQILITGGAGFVGSHLADALLAAGHNVTVVDNLSTGLRTNVPAHARFIHADVRSELDPVFRTVRPEVVYHLAAQVSVPDSVQDPSHDLAVNVQGAVNVLESAARVSARKLVAVSSAAVYGAPQILPIREDHVQFPLSPYGLSKLTGEAYVRLIAPIRGLQYTILRPANIYGPRQRAEGEGAVVPAFVTRLLAGKDPVIHGDGSQTRDFIYVKDMVQALVQAGTRADGMVLNASTGSAVTVAELWHLIAGNLGWKRPPVFGPARVGDIPHSVMANAMARQALNWRPSVVLAEGLAHTVAWSISDQAAPSRE